MGCNGGHCKQDKKDGHTVEIKNGHLVVLCGIHNLKMNSWLVNDLKSLAVVVEVHKYL